MTREEKETIYLEIEVAPGEYREDKFEVSYEVEPYRPGKTYGLPENCYPPEGGYANGYGPVTRRYEDSEGEYKEEVSWEVFVELWAAATFGCEVLQAEDGVNEVLYECWQQRMAARDDDEMDRRVDERLERERKP